MLPETRIKIDSILLFILVLPFVMTYRIGIGDTPYWLFAIIFLLLTGYLILDLINMTRKRFMMLKNITLFTLIAVVIVSSFFSAIIVRHKNHPIYMIHDIILQQEAAIQFFLHGKNPYAETYFGTFMEQWNYSDKEVNPALYHFVMEPFYLVSALPFYYVSNHTIGYFDGRIPLVFLFAVVIVTGYFIVNDSEQQRLFMILLAFHPSILPYTLEGRSDIYMFAFLLLGFYFLSRGKNMLSAITLALAFTVKQSAWPLFPFYFLYLLWREKNIIKVSFPLIVFTSIFLIIVLPFFLWNPHAFIDSTISFLSGSTAHSYPISGYGLGSMLLQFGLITDKSAYYPFVIWQLLFCIPVFFALVVYLKKHVTVKRMIVCYGLFLFLFWYLSRYFNNSHLAYLSLVFLTAYFWPENEEKKKKNKSANTQIRAKT
jgi:uncharacterized membrane protein